MRTLFLLRHSMTMANEERLYCGSTDLPLSAEGRRLASQMKRERPLPDGDLYATSGMARTNETLALLTGKAPDLILEALREMDFGRFEMLSYDSIKDDPDYVRWIEDDTGTVACPGGESSSAFRERVFEGGRILLEKKWSEAIVVCHGGVIVSLMQAWFPSESRSFYEWQPGPCRGWRIAFDGTSAPVGFMAI